MVSLLKVVLTLSTYVRHEYQFPDITLERAVRKGSIAGRGNDLIRYDSFYCSGTVPASQTLLLSFHTRGLNVYTNTHEAACKYYVGELVAQGRRRDSELGHAHIVLCKRQAQALKVQPLFILCSPEGVSKSIELPKHTQLGNGNTYEPDLPNTIREWFSRRCGRDD